MKAMVNFLQMDDHLATAGSPTTDDLVRLAKEGWQVVINLALDDSPNAIPGEAELITSLGMEYHPIPVEWELPRLEDLQAFFAVMETNFEKRIFVHCVMNMRVSVFLYLYRILRQGWRPEVARLDLDKIWEPNETWAEFIQEALQTLN
jgi:protein tyrosine phosphatase (PTP) superfamily phosphohydrolase (DUF442 family)